MSVPILPILKAPTRGVAQPKWNVLDLFSKIKTHFSHYSQGHFKLLIRKQKLGSHH